VTVRRRLACLLAAGVLAPTLAACGSGTSGPLRIGVMLPLTGPDAVGFRPPLDWAADAVNAAGGVRGRHLELVYRDSAREPAASLARSFAKDSSIVATIGPDNSRDTLQAATAFVKAGKVLVTPSATSADLFRAFSGSKPQYFWRPVESDIGQARTLLGLATRGGARSVALVAGEGEYGTTFFDWLGFLAVEANVEVKSTIRYEQGQQPCEESIDDALATNPDVLLAVPDGAAEAVCMAKAWRARGTRTRLLFSDAAQDPSLVQTLGAGAEGLEGTGLAPDPANGFASAFEQRFNTPPTPYAASTYDSLLMLAYGLARSGGHGGRSLAAGIADVVAGAGAPVGWDGGAVRRALAEVSAGRRPAISGAVGPWNFDKKSGIERVASTYEHWRIAGGKFTIADYVSTADAGTARQGLAEGEAQPTEGRGPATVGGAYQPGPKTGTWALLVAASDGWDNYRHQADVLAQYQRLRANGVPADHIVVVMADDVARNRSNARKGTVRYTPGGPNLYREVRADYSPKTLQADDLMDVLSGQVTPGTQKVLHSGPGDNVYVFFAGHGNHQGLYLGLGDAVPSSSDRFSVLSPSALGSTVAIMAREHRYRRMFVAVEACQAGVFGSAVHSPGVFLLSAASPVEDSLSANYDSSLSTWLADQFSYQLWQEQARPDTSIGEVYRRVYLAVGGSHVGAYGPEFGNPADVSIGEFLTP
jgi:ABC-type branched-subunit amino acid transport system substrate-binding protein